MRSVHSLSISYTHLYARNSIIYYTFHIAASVVMVMVVVEYGKWNQLFIWDLKNCARIQIFMSCFVFLSLFEISRFPRDQQTLENHVLFAGNVTTLKRLRDFGKKIDAIISSSLCPLRPINQQKFVSVKVQKLIFSRFWENFELWLLSRSWFNFFAIISSKLRPRLWRKPILKFTKPNAAVSEFWNFKLKIFPNRLWTCQCRYSQFSFGQVNIIFLNDMSYAM